MLKRLFVAFAIAACVIVAACQSHANAATVDNGSAVEVFVGEGHGSGVYLGNGWVLTAAHVAAGAPDNATKIKRVRNESWTDEWTADVVWTDTRQDFALLKIRGEVANLSAAVIDCGDMALGQDVTVVGWPADLGMVQSRGYVAAGKEKRGPWQSAFVVVAPIFFGNSGGPVYNQEGDVAGLAVGILQGTSLSIVIPVSAVCKQLPSGVHFR